jgi:hypothetical protein
MRRNEQSNGLMLDLLAVGLQELEEQERVN